jgi:hypothetical protein
MKNTRSLDVIAGEIHALERKGVIEVGKLLLEANEQCEHGQWLAWLDANGWSASTAERQMKVARMAAKFPKLANLKVAKGTLYDLTEYDDRDLPAIITELGKHATTSRLAPRDARRVIRIGIARRRFGDHPDATLYQLGRLDEQAPWRAKAILTLKNRKPTTDEVAEALVAEVRKDVLGRASG